MASKWARKCASKWASKWAMISSVLASNIMSEPGAKNVHEERWHSERGGQGGRLRSGATHLHSIIPRVLHALLYPRRHSNVARGARR
jgi:hypothetical protein